MLVVECFIHVKYIRLTRLNASEYVSGIFGDI